MIGPSSAVWFNENLIEKLDFDELGHEMKLKLNRNVGSKCGSEKGLIETSLTHKRERNGKF